MFSISRLKDGGFNLLYCTGSFYHKNNGWPEDYMELSVFVQQSHGYLMLSNYNRIDFKTLPDDGLQVCYVLTGGTNVVEFTLKDISKKQ